MEIYEQREKRVLINCANIFCLWCFGLARCCHFSNKHQNKF